MLEFDFEIHRIEGTENKAADLLSRIANKHKDISDKNKTTDEIIQEVIQEEKEIVIANHYHNLPNSYKHNGYKTNNYISSNKNNPNDKYYHWK